MSDKFLGYGQGSVNLTNGSATIFSATLGAASLTASKPVKTNSVKQLVSANLDIPDINNLQTQLNEKDELTFVEDDTHNNPPSGKVKIYAKTDGGVYKLDSAGNETSLGGGSGGVSTTNPPVLDNALVFYDGTDGTRIKQINGIYYDSLNSALQVDDLETSATFSLNDDLQLISNIQSATQTPNVITDFAGEIHVAKIKSASHNTELEFETGGSATLTADADITLFTGTGDITLNGQNIALACPNTNLTLNGDNVRFLITDTAKDTFGGVDSGINLTTGFNNTSVGYFSLKEATEGKFNSAFGANAGEKLTTGERNTFVGSSSGLLLTTGDNNTAIGAGSSSYNTTGDNNTSIGVDALNGNDGGADNVAIGYTSLYYSSASQNTAIGKACMYNTIAGENNTAIGFEAGNSNTGGNRNIFLGAYSGQQNITGINNSYLGYYSGAVAGVNPVNSTALGAFSTITSNDQIVLGNVDIIEVVSGSDGLCDLGSSSKRFKDLYVAGNIYGGTPYDFSFACTDEVNTITSTGQKMFMRAPRNFNVQKFKVSLNSAGGAGFALNIKKNGTNMVNTITLGTTITTITPFTAVSVSEDDEITVDVSNIGSGTGVGLKVYLIGKT